MSIPWKCSPNVVAQPGEAIEPIEDAPCCPRRTSALIAARRAWRLDAARAWIIPLAAVLFGCGGCQILAVLGSGRGPKVEAQFRLTDGPLLVFIDDIHENVDWPPARQYLWDDLSQELLRTKAAQRIIPRETLDALRQTMPDFDKKSCREIGEFAGADQILWIEPQDFLADEQITDATNAAYFAASVKVLNAKEKQSRSRVRLWPMSPDGQMVTANMTGGAVLKAKDKDEISRELTAKLAVDIAKLFYEHREGEIK